MIIHVNQVEKQPLHLEGTEPASVLDLMEREVQLDEPLRYRLDVELIAGGVLVQGRLAARAHMVCARCLERFAQELEVPNFVHLHEDLSVESFDLTPLMREDILLLLPQRAVCSPDCRGLCPRCGVNLNLDRCSCSQASSDARWSALDRFEPRQE